MALKDIWTPKRDGIDDILAKDINDIAEEVIETQANVEENSGKINALETPANVTTRDASLSEFEITGNSYSVSENSISFFGGGSAYIKHNGWINFNLSVNSTLLDMVQVYVDDVLAEKYRGYRYTGEVKERITISYGGIDPTTDMTFRTLQIKEIKGGILSDADYESFMKTKDSVTENKNSIAENKNSIEKLEMPAHMGQETVSLVGITHEDYMRGISVTEDTITTDSQSMAQTITIDYQGNVDFEIHAHSDCSLMVDGEVVDTTGSSLDDTTLSYVGEVKENMQISVPAVANLTMNVTKFIDKVYEGGILSDADYKDFCAMKKAIGNIGATFDEVHEYAESLIGGEEA